MLHTRMFMLKESNYSCAKFEKDLLFSVLLHYSKLIRQLKGFSSLLLIGKFEKKKI